MHHHLRVSGLVFMSLLASAQSAFAEYQVIDCTLKTVDARGNVETQAKGTIDFVQGEKLLSLGAFDLIGANAYYNSANQSLAQALYIDDVALSRQLSTISDGDFVSTLRSSIDVQIGSKSYRQVVFNCGLRTIISP